MTPRASRGGPESAVSSLLNLPPWLLAALPGCAVALGVSLPLVLLVMARAAGGPFAFPLDDSWIHLNYARNLADHGAFTYFPGDRTSAGSTAPLFTLLEAIGFKLTHNEFAIALTLGLIAQLVFLIALAAWASRRLGHPGWAALAVAMVALDGRFAILAASGMETSLFLALMALAFLGWSRGDVTRAAAAAGLAVWVRPEALVLAGVFAIDALIERRARRSSAAAVGLFAVVVAAYAMFNRATGGVAFPNTLAAKAAFYAGRPFGDFLRDDVGATFAAGWLLLIPFAIFQAVREVRRMLQPRPPLPPGPDPPFDSTVMRADLGWALALPLAYAIVLPISHRFNRYLIPALPGLAIAGVAGLRATIAAATWRFKPVYWRLVATSAALVLLMLQAFYFSSAPAEYVRVSHYHAVRHVRAGRWLAEHTPRDAVVAAHDVGAIAYYSKRRVVDMAGLVTPEVIPHLHKPDYIAFLDSLFARQRVTYLAVLEEWQPVDNQLPVFEADPEPEVLHIYEWRRGATHLLAPQVRSDLNDAAAALAAGQFERSRTLLERVFDADSTSGSAWILAGAFDERGGRAAEAERDYRRAVELFPESPAARGGYGMTLVRAGRIPEAQAELDTMLVLDRFSPQAALLRDAIERATRAP